MATSLAYFVMFSLAPVTFIALTVAGVFIDELAMANRLFTILNNVVGPDAAAFVEESVLSMEQSTSGGTFFISIISFMAILLAASGVFFNLQT